MDIQKTIEVMDGIQEIYGNLPEDGDEIEIALIDAKNALKELQQYRKIGTVDELRELKGKLEQHQQPVLAEETYRSLEKLFSMW